jgi:phosphoserine phosphatase RsbU/P
MTVPPNPPPESAIPKRQTESFWERVTEGLELHQLWGQFRSEAKASYGLFSHDVDWEGIDQKSRGPRRILHLAWGLFQAMLMKLSPARRVLLLVAIFFLAVHPRFRTNTSHEFSIQLGGIGVAILFVLLAMELADRVTMKRDLEIAREVQQWLVPKHPPDAPGTDIAFATRPQNTVAGDYFDAFLRTVPVRDTGLQPLLLVVADVAGKSIPAALLMATFQASLHALTETSATLDEIVAGLSRYCRAHSLDGRRFTTAFIAEINLDTREMLYVNAGHNAPILRRASGEIDRLSIGGPPFGIPAFTENETPFPTGRVMLEPGDCVYIFTDGVVEAVNDAGEEYGEERLVPCIQVSPAESADEMLKRVMTEVNTFVGYTRQHDDITSLVLRITT